MRQADTLFTPFASLQFPCLTRQVGPSCHSKQSTSRFQSPRLAMSSLLAQALNSFKSAAVAAHASALAPGQPAGGQGLEDFLGMAAAEQKRYCVDRWWS